MSNYYRNFNNSDVEFDIFGGFQCLPRDVVSVEPPEAENNDALGLLLDGNTFHSGFSAQSTLISNDSQVAGYNLSLETGTGWNLGNYDPFLNTPLLSPLPLPLDSSPSSVATTPELLTPGSSTFSLTPSPVQEQFSFESFVDPRLFQDDNHSASLSPENVEEDPILTESSKGKAREVPTIEVVDEDVGFPSPFVPPSPLPTLPSDFCIVQRPSAAGPSRRDTQVRRSTRSVMTSTPTTMGTIRTSATKDAKATSFKARSAHRQPALCPFPGCTHQGTFYNQRTLTRHIAAMHNADREPWYCPGMCRRQGFARDDALNRHLRDSGEHSVCRINARKLGWNPKVKCSVRDKLRGIPPAK